MKFDENSSFSFLSIFKKSNYKKFLKNDGVKR